MFVTLVLAGILGAAIGWLIHRAAYASKLEEYRHALSRAHSQAAQTESEVNMLTDDYDELRRRSKLEIDSLRSENKQIPFLNTNLEKSQLLVRQMMQKHEAKVRDLTSENQSLSAKLKTIEDREQAYNKVKVELDSIRRQKAVAAKQQYQRDTRDSADAADNDEFPKTAVSDTTLAADKVDSKYVTTDSVDNSISRSHDSKQQEVSTLSTNNDTIDAGNDAIDTDVLNDIETGANGVSGSGPVKESDRNNYESDSESQEIEILDATVASKPADAFIQNLKETTKLPETRSSWASSPIVIDADHTKSKEQPSIKQPATDVTSIGNVGTGGDGLKLMEKTPTVKVKSDSDSHVEWVDVSKLENGNSNEKDDIVDVSKDELEIDDTSPDRKTTEADDNEDPFDDVMVVANELQRELDIDANDPLLDGSNDSASLFEPVEHRDDLKQIFGIGPVTEKALNELGITSYSQLAELKSHEIEKIAGALSIVPGRIERDNWVGNARKQLEEVLEGL